MGITYSKTYLIPKLKNKMKLLKKKKINYIKKIKKMKYLNQILILLVQIHFQVI